MKKYGVVVKPIDAKRIEISSGDATYILYSDGRNGLEIDRAGGRLMNVDVIEDAGPDKINVSNAGMIKIN